MTTAFRAKCYKQLFRRGRMILEVPWAYGPLVENQRRAEILVLFLRCKKPELETRVQKIDFEGSNNGS